MSENLLTELQEAINIEDSAPETVGHILRGLVNKLSECSRLVQTLPKTDFF